ncbi:MAG: LacI family DNA-binding transcriptional regulator [Clostridia bacterium]|nr:LacI family DNA-binding transcriptional regulator [Clostridia bacterium]
MNLQMLANLAGVSVSTVSKAFSGSADISQPTRDRIFALARQHGCFDRYNKHKFGKKVIAVISPEPESDFYNKMLVLLGDAIAAADAVMTVSFSRFSPERVRELFIYYSSYCRADGIIIIGSAIDVENPFRVPAVCLGGTVNCTNVDAVSLDTHSAFHDAIAHLKQHGHTCIGIAGERLTLGTTGALCGMLREHGLPVDERYILTSDQRFEQAGLEMGEAFFQMQPRPTAVLAAYDYIAIGIIKAFTAHGLKVPHDLSVIGANDIAILPYLETPLSTVRCHVDEACALAVDILRKKMDNCYFSTHTTHLIPSDFVARNSSGPCPGGTAD